MSNHEEDVHFRAPPRSSAVAPAAGHSISAPALHDLTIVSDVICPWCYIAKRHLDMVLESTALGSSLNVSWEPYELNPSMPANGMDRRAYRSRKFGSWERSTVLDAQITTAGSRAGIAFRFDLMTRTPNSFQAHRLIWFAGRAGVQNAVVDALFRAYFTEGRDVGELGVLIDIGADGGIEKERVATFLGSKDGIDEVRAAEQSALRAGIAAVPTFFLDDKPLFSGAVQPDVMAARLNDGLAAR